MKALNRVLGLAGIAGIATLMLAVAGCGGGSDLGGEPPPPPTAVGGVETPLVTAAPQSTTRVVGQAAVFDVAATGPNLNFEWQQNQGAGWVKTPEAFTSDATSSQLRIPSVNIGQNNTAFRGVAKNTAASVPSAEAVLSVTWGAVETLEPNNDFGFGTGSEGFGSADGGSPGGGDGEGAGAGGGLGKTVQTWITVARVADGAALGSARTGSTTGLVRIKAGPGTAPILLTLAGSDISTYYDEGKGAMLPLPADQHLHSLVNAFDQHLGVTILTEAAYRYAINNFILDPAQVRSGAVALKRVATAEEIARLTPAQIQLAQEAIRAEINRILPARYALASIATLPTPVDVNSGRGSITSNRYGIMQAVVGGLSAAAGQFNPSLAQPALVMNAQLADDLTDGVINGLSLDQRSVFGAPGSAYGPGSLAGLLEDAADAQFAQFGDDATVIAPRITVQPQSATITQGGTANLSVTASGTTLSYQWFNNGVAIAGATRASYATTVGGTYRVDVSNSAGTVPSSNATVTVVPVVVAPSITTQPASASITAGGSHTFTVVAAGSNVAYQWRNASGPITGATSSSYTTGAAGSYSVVVSNSAGTVTSSVATLTVTAVVVAPVITLQPPASTEINSGTTTILNVGVNDGGGTLTYQWRNATGPISGATSATYTTGTAGTYTVVVSNSAGSVTSSAAVVIVVTTPVITTQPASAAINAGATHTFTVGATGRNLAFQWFDATGPITGATAATYATGTAGTYHVDVSNSAGSVSSADAVLTVTPVVTLPVITTQPASITIPAGTTTTLSVVATGTGLSYQWRNAAVNITGATSSSYTTGVAGAYTVVITNAAGPVTSATATVIVTPAPTLPVITTQPASITILAGTTTTLTVVATGATSYQWRNAAGPITGATLASYTTGVAGTYTVVVSNGVGPVTSAPATVTVTPAPTLPVITTQPASITIPAGTTTTLTVVATGATSYQWRNANGNIAGATSASYITGAAGPYTVVVTNAVGSVTSAIATVTVSAVTAPTISTQPVSASAPAGQSRTFTVVAAGGNLSYQWRIIPVGAGPIAILGATSASYTTATVGTYNVLITNAAGSVTSNNVTLSTAAALPVITTQPVSVTIPPGLHTFNVVATGGPLTYQWYLAEDVGDFAISGETSSSYATDAEGAYFVVVTNTAGETTSNTVTLTFSAGPIP